jgi:hypothetical protein
MTTARYALLIVLFVAWPHARAAETADPDRVVDAVYEQPFVAIGRNTGPGSMWLAIGKREFDTGTFVNGHRGIRVTSCWAPGLHFCMAGAPLTFAVPEQKIAVPGWWTRLGNLDVRILSRQQTSFRNKKIDTVILTVTSTDAGSESDLIVYNYDIGVIAFTAVAADGIERPARRVPLILSNMSILSSADGVGGKQQCQHWTCGD